MILYVSFIVPPLLKLRRTCACCGCFRFSCDCCCCDCRGRGCDCCWCDRRGRGCVRCCCDRRGRGCGCGCVDLFNCKMLGFLFGFLFSVLNCCKILSGCSSIFFFLVHQHFSMRLVSFFDLVIILFLLIFEVGNLFFLFWCGFYCKEY